MLEERNMIVLAAEIRNYINMYPNHNQGDPKYVNKTYQPNQTPPPQHSNIPPYTPYAQKQQQNLNPPSQPQSRAVYTSMIVPQSNPSFEQNSIGGFGGLSNMGRVIKQQPDPMIKVSQPNQQFQYSQPQPPQQSPNTLSFRNSGQKPKMSSSMIFPQETNSYQQGSGQGFGTNRLQGLMGKGKLVQEDPNQTAEQKRKREIVSIKQELSKLNKKMENFSFKKPGEQGTNKQYFQLPTRKTSVMQPSTPDTQNNTHLNVFKGYSGGSSTTNNTNTNLNTNTNNSSQPLQNTYKDSNTQDNLRIQPEAMGLQHSLSANQLRKRQDPPAMFKKKVNQFELQPPKQQQAPKTFLLSPRAQNTQNPPLPPRPITPKQAEMVLPPAPKKTLKRVDSTTYEARQPPPPPPPQFFKQEKKVRQFRKSDFIVGKKMGKGQFGEVMMVVHKDTGFLCAMKVMSKKQIRQQKYENQIARELSIQFYLSHRNVSPLYGFFDDEEDIYLLVEFATGGQLLQTLRKAHRMEEADCSPIIREVCEGLDYIHKEQIIHRDIKPQNILFNFDTVKICDFGWAVHSGNGMRRTVAGSPLYYSPEVVKETVYDQKIDIWAIGMMTYESILGKIPFRIYSQLDLNRIVEDEIKFPQYVDVTEELKQFVLKICKKDPEERMDMRDIMRHPFITKYSKNRKVSNEIYQDIAKFLSK